MARNGIEDRKRMLATLQLEGRNVFYTNANYLTTNYTTEGECDKGIEGKTMCMKWVLLATYMDHRNGMSKQK